MKIAVPLLTKLPEAYAEALASLGGEAVPVAVPVSPEGFDGLLLPGGGDVDPSRYGEDNHGSQGISEALDELQFSCLDAFVKAGKPILGICRGLQVINVYFGGTLIQHLPSAGRHAEKGPQGEDSIHPDRSIPGTVMEALYGTEFISNSSHHQAADRIGRGLQVMAVSDDGVVEAMYHETLPILCTQFHPERMCLSFADDRYADGAKIIGAFVDLCRRNLT